MWLLVIQSMCVVGVVGVYGAGVGVAVVVGVGDIVVAVECCCCDV